MHHLIGALGPGQTLNFMHEMNQTERIKFMISSTFDSIYCKIPIISPGLIFVKKAVLLGLFSGELISEGAYYRKEFCVSKWVWLDNKNSLKQLALTDHGLIFRRAYYRNDFCV